MYGLANVMVQGFQESDMDMLLLLFKSPYQVCYTSGLLLVDLVFCLDCGSTLRSEDPAALKDIIAEINAKAAKGT